MRRVLLALVAVLAVLVPGTPAWAHVRLVSADPGQGVALAAAPTAVTLTFSERLNPDFATIVVSDAAIRRVAASAPVINAATGVVTLTRPLANGLHTVAYRVVSVDGHTLQGSYTFTVADPALSAAGPAPAAASGGLPLGWVALGVGLVALGLGLVVLRRRRT